MPRVHVSAALCAAACYSAAANNPRVPGAELARYPHPQIHVAISAANVAPVRSPSTVPRTEPASEGHARCPNEMAFVERSGGGFCIDRWEASLAERKAGGELASWPGNRRFESGVELVAVSVAGQKPQAYISGAESALACQRAGKRLCELDEWVRACRGPHAHTYPYGDHRERDRCNDRYRVLDDHPVVALFERFAPRGSNRSEMWQERWMNDPRLYDMPRSVEPTGQRRGCRSDYDTYDMVGNLHEWIADPDGTFVGGFFMDTFQNGEGCGYRTRAHDFDYHDYSTGFRCCEDRQN
jgi:sulfatase modifying factor 1